MKKKSFKNEDQELIRSILGRNKFLMLPIEFIKALGPNGACYLTYILDKAEYLLSIEKMKNLEDSFYIFRRDFRNNLSLSDYLQKNIESKLKELEIIQIVEVRECGETWNEYKLNIMKVYELFQKYENDPLKKFNPPPQNI